eukprot:2843553-Rhodomonas_salina.1
MGRNARVGVPGCDPRSWSHRDVCTLGCHRRQLERPGSVPDTSPRVQMGNLKIITDDDDDPDRLQAHGRGAGRRPLSPEQEEERAPAAAVPSL